MNILSIQSHVAYGHVGNSSAVFAMQRLGHEVWPVHTVQLSNHTGYGTVRGRAFEAALIDECVTGIGELGALARCDGVLSGYVGAPDTGAAILRAVERVKASNGKALYCCDPVIGDEGKIYTKPGVREFFRDALVPHADIVIPNLFELSLLSGLPVGDLAEVRRAIAALGPRIVLITSMTQADTPDDRLDMIASEGGQCWRLRKPRFNRLFNGAGDLIAALFLVSYLARRSVPQALEEAGSAVHAILSRTVQAGTREIALIEAQDELVDPPVRFTAEAL